MTASVPDPRLCYEVRKSLSLGLARCLWKQSVCLRSDVYGLNRIPMYRVQVYQIMMF